MANDHAIPEHETEKLHGDKLESVLGSGVAPAQSPSASSGAPSHLQSHSAALSGDAEGGDGGQALKNDGKLMP
jgi:hypothetical protein